RVVDAGVAKAVGQDVLAVAGFQRGERGGAPRVFDRVVEETEECRELVFGQARGQLDHHLTSLPETIGERLRRTNLCRGRVVEFVRQPGGQRAEGDQLVALT